MALSSGSFPRLLLFFLLSALVVFLESTDTSKLNVQSIVEENQSLQNCIDCDHQQVKNDKTNNLVEFNESQPESFDITVTYVDASGVFKTHKVKSKDLSSSWVWENSAEGHGNSKFELEKESSYQQRVNNFQENTIFSTNQNQQPGFISPIKLKRQKLRQKRKEQRVVELTNMSKETELQIEAAAIERTNKFSHTVKGKYSIWRKEFQPTFSDSTLKLMKDQIIMAKVYASIALSLKKYDLYDSLLKYAKESQLLTEDASSDADLHSGALDQAKVMSVALSKAKDVLYDVDVISKKLQVMVQSAEDMISGVKKQSTFLIQHAAKTYPKPLHCLSLHLTTDYFLENNANVETIDNDKLTDTSLFHYAIFSDNVLAASVVVNSTVVHAKEPEKHVFHIVTDKLNFAAMKMWFIAFPPLPATVHVENIDEFRWLNSSYCSVLRQLESAKIKEYYFKADHSSSLSAGNENLKYRNPNMKGMVNGAVETCKESFHRFDKYLNFSNPKISDNFDPQACGWAFGMNMFDLKEWKKRNITGIYHYWQDSNEDRKLWKLGSLPPGLITFYNLTYPLERSWHVLGLGYDPAISPTDIENAAVVHYNGNYKPWLDLAIAKYKKYWSKFVPIENPYIKECYVEQ